MAQSITVSSTWLSWGTTVASSSSVQDCEVTAVEDGAAGATGELEPMCMRRAALHLCVWGPLSPDRAHPATW